LGATNLHELNSQIQYLDGLGQWLKLFLDKSSFAIFKLLTFIYKSKGIFIKFITMVIYRDWFIL